MRPLYIMCQPWAIMLWRGASRCFFCTFVAGLSVTAGGVLSLGAIWTGLWKGCGSSLYYLLLLYSSKYDQSVYRTHPRLPAAIRVSL